MTENNIKFLILNYYKKEFDYSYEETIDLISFDNCSEMIFDEKNNKIRILVKEGLTSIKYIFKIKNKKIIKVKTKINIENI